MGTFAIFFVLFQAIFMAVWASKWNRNWFAWFVMTLIAAPLCGFTGAAFLVAVGSALNFTADVNPANLTAVLGGPFFGWAFMALSMKHVGINGKRCPACTEICAAEATICKHCGSPFPAAETAPA